MWVGEAIFWLIVGWLMNRALVAVARDNYGTIYNGYGSVDDTLNRTAQAPMVYRVLVPWGMVALSKLKIGKIESYELLRLLLIGGALWSVRLAWGWEVATLAAVILPATFYYDYWDWAGELMGLNLALTGNIPLAWVGMILWGMSRETAVLSGLAFGMVTGNWMMGIMLSLGAVAVYLFLRLIQGEHELYCKRVMIKDNLVQLRYFYKGRPALMYGEAISLGLLLLGIVGGVLDGWRGLLPGVLAGAGLILGRVDESRIFSGLVPWAALALTKLIGG